MQRAQKGLVWVLAGLSVLALPNWAFAQPVVQKWVARYSAGPEGTQDDVAEDIAVDQAGNVYVTGWTTRLTTPWDDDYCTIKYSPTGAPLWASPACYSGPSNSDDRAYALVVDSAGNVYVTGTSGSNGVTIKYNGATGTAIWTVPYSGGALYDIALDFTDGSVFVTGKAGTNCLTIRYNASNGAQVWAKTDVAGSAEAIAVSPGGDAYITGQTSSPSDYLTVKYAFANGALLWSRTLNGTGNLSDIAHDIVVDDAANAYVTGESRGGSSTNYDIVTRSYDMTGAVRWTSTYNGNGVSQDKGFAIALGGDGNVAVTGYDLGISPSESRDIVTVKYAGGTGMQLWAATYNGPAGREDWGNDIALDQDGNVYVTGWSQDEFAEEDYVTLKYTAGTLRWAITYNGPISGEDWGLAIAVDEFGCVYVTGGSDSGTPSSMDKDFATIKYSQNGAGDGDLNCDGVVNAFDIDAFVLALTNPASYEDAYPCCNVLNADINDDGVINAFDIDPFVVCLTTGNC